MTGLGGMNLALLRSRAIQACMGAYLAASTCHVLSRACLRSGCDGRCLPLGQSVHDDGLATARGGSARTLPLPAILIRTCTCSH